MKVADTKELFSLDATFCCKTAVLSYQSHQRCISSVVRPLCSSAPGSSHCSMLQLGCSTLLLRPTTFPSYFQGHHFLADSVRTNPGISRSKSYNMNISFCFDFFLPPPPPPLCVCVNPRKTGWPDSAQPGSAQLRHSSFLLILLGKVREGPGSSWMHMASSCTSGKGIGGHSIDVKVNGA